MHAVILAGGAGTRLRPLTYARRKELVPLLDRPLLEYRLANLREHGVADVVVACSEGVREIEQCFGDGSSLGIRLRFNYETRPLGSGRAVKEAARAAGAAGTLVVCNGDILTNVDLSAMIARHRETHATLSMSLAAVEDPWAYGVVEVDGELRIRSFVEKPPKGEEPSNLINAGTWLWEPKILERIADDETAVRDGYSERVLFPGIIAGGLRAQGFVEDLWVDVGSPERYLRATRLLIERAGGGPHIAPSANVAGDASISAYSSVGGDAVVGAGAVVEDSALWEGASVGAGARIVRSIIGGGCAIGDGAELIDGVLADGASVAPGRRLEPGARLMPGEAV
jgi:mannose-1-phosphate guanylyltransferase